MERRNGVDRGASEIVPGDVGRGDTQHTRPLYGTAEAGSRLLGERAEEVRGGQPDRAGLLGRALRPGRVAADPLRDGRDTRIPNHRQGCTRQLERALDIDLFPPARFDQLGFVPMICRTAADRPVHPTRTARDT
ncbi:hypothetical protein [Nocardia brevicatena]|uniref:hypothetical protein n=1 Tax=Nocardia brevicatena TaxID=37327 RepID=UPI001C3F4639|nr:hypothetical protein [Nocardia brevicatena]